jgi:hypothetical protein
MTQDEKKQKTICRQSNLKWIFDYSKHINQPLTISEMVRMTEALTIYCTDGRTTIVKEMLERVDKHFTDKFEE